MFEIGDVLLVSKCIQSDEQDILYGKQMSLVV